MEVMPKQRKKSSPIKEQLNIGRDLSLAITKARRGCLLVKEKRT